MLSGGDKISKVYIEGSTVVIILNKADVFAYSAFVQDLRDKGAIPPITLLEQRGWKIVSGIDKAIRKLNPSSKR